MVVVKKAGNPNYLSNDGYHKKIIQTTLFFVYPPYQVVKKKPFCIILYSLYPGVFHFLIM